MRRALLVIDLINEMVDSNGKLAAKGYADFIARHRTFDNLNAAIGVFRKSGDPVIFMRLAFAADYHNCPKSSPLFGGAQKIGILANKTWSTEIHSAVDCRVSEDKVFVKTRVSAFHLTRLAEELDKRDIFDIYIAGVATDLAVEATARAGHDLDFNVNVVTDACAAASDEDHANSLRFLPKIANVVTVAEL